MKVVLRHFSIRQIVRTCVRPLYATHLRCGTYWCTSLRVQINPEDSYWSGVKRWFSRSRPCDRLLHKSSENFDCAPRLQGAARFGRQARGRSGGRSGGRAVRHLLLPRDDRSARRQDRRAEAPDAGGGPGRRGCHADPDDSRHRADRPLRRSGPALRIWKLSSRGAISRHTSASRPDSIRPAASSERDVPARWGRSTRAGFLSAGPWPLIRRDEEGDLYCTHF